MIMDYNVELFDVDRWGASATDVQVEQQWEICM